ncbi:hypothetical protein [uncultured Phycicoccus sp.]|uniref:hypothetical protein n=1 Tax=uncultured Phycicoccus sp. TaxID=661422 RepID=UPI002623B15F|nr:hypothetical protein [uncultured Phycicoccus sp.]
MAHLAPTSTTSTGLPDTASPLALRIGSVVALTMTAVTVGTFALALMAGADDSPYPFTSDVIAAQWPGDYLWMYPAMLLMLLFVVVIAAVHEYAPADRKIFSLVGVCLAVIAAAVLLITYFIQVTVMQPSLEKGQLDGWAMLTMYNPNGVFIALEELGFLLMSLALAVLAPVFRQRNKVERTIRWLFVACFALAVGALAAVSATRGIDRGVFFEISVISIVWSTLIVAGPLLAVVLRREPAESTSASPVTEDGA